MAADAPAELRDDEHDDGPPRRAQEQVGGFRAHDGIVEDLDLWVRLLALGPARVSPKVSVVYHVHGVQITEDLPRTRAAHLSVADAYRAPGWPRSLLARQRRGAQAWDQLRDSLAQRALRPAAGRALLITTSPARVRGVLELLAWRLRPSRARHQVGRDGEPSLALLVASGQRAGLPFELTHRERADLRGRGRVAVLVQLARRPAGVAVADFAGGGADCPGCFGCPRFAAAKPANPGGPDENRAGRAISE